MEQMTYVWLRSIDALGCNDNDIVQRGHIYFRMKRSQNVFNSQDECLESFSWIEVTLEFFQR